MKDRLGIHIPLHVFCYWPHNTPLHFIHITPCPLCLFTSHHDIITQPHPYCCYIINFTVYISSHFLQTIAHLIHLLQTIVHPIHCFYHSPSHSHLPYLVALIAHGHLTLFSLPPFSHSRLWKLTNNECL